MGSKPTFRQRVLHEVKKTAFTTIYFLIGFNLLALLFALLAPEFRGPASMFAGATVAALVVGKVIVVSDGVFRRFVKGSASFLTNVAVKSITFTLVVIVALALEELVHGVTSEDLSWSASFQHVLVSADGGRRFLARFAYLIVLFSVYGFLFEIDRYFVGTPIADIIRSKYRDPQASPCTVMQIGLANPIPGDPLHSRTAVVRELYDAFSRLATDAGGHLTGYRGRRAIVLWDEQVPRGACRDLFAAMTDYLAQHADRHRDTVGRPLRLRGAVAAGAGHTVEVTSGPHREVIRTGAPFDRADLLEHAAEPGELVFDDSVP